MRSDHLTIEYIIFLIQFKTSCEFLIRWFLFRFEHSENIAKTVEFSSNETVIRPNTFTFYSIAFHIMFPCYFNDFIENAGPHVNICINYFETLS